MIALIAAAPFSIYHRDFYGDTRRTPPQGFDLLGVRTSSHHKESTIMSTAGVIGLGAIGGGVAICLARSGHLKAVYDIRKDASDKLPGVPAVTGSPAEVARQCDVVMIAVLDAKQTRDVLTGPEGVLTQVRPGL